MTFFYVIVKVLYLTFVIPFSYSYWYHCRWRGLVPLGIGDRRSESKKLEWWRYGTEKEVWRYLQPFGYSTPTWQTERRTNTGRQQRPRFRIASRGKKHCRQKADVTATNGSAVVLLFTLASNRMFTSW